MRKIKFRAWDGEKMDYDPVCCTDGPEITKLNSNIQSMCEEWHRPKYLALMQFTGLKDKNGKEIYEGDILVEREIFREVKEVEWDEQITGFSPFNDYDSDCQKYYEVGECKIIGNRYENPELLK